MATLDRPLSAADWLRPSSFIIAVGVGVGAGLSTPGGIGPALVVGGQWFGWTLAVVFGVPFILTVLHLVVDLSNKLAARREMEGEADETPPPLRSPLVGGGLVSDLDRYVAEGLMLTLRHARASGGLTFAQIGHAFNGSTADWVWWTNVLAASRLCDKQNGVSTVLPPGKTYWWAMREVLRGNYELPTLGSDSPLPPLPTPLAPEGIDKVKVEQA